MLQNEKNKHMSKQFFFIFTIVMGFLASCGNPPPKVESKSDSTKAVIKTKGGTLPERNNVAVPDGNYEEHYKNGILKIKGFYLKGQRHGQWASFYENGNLWSEQQYTNGKKDGQNVSYYPNGKKRYEGNYRNDTASGIWKYWNEDGTLAHEVNNDKKQ